jgi:hypothetical protein
MAFLKKVAKKVQFYRKNTKIVANRLRTRAAPGPLLVANLTRRT